MNENPPSQSKLGAILGGIVALAAVLFLATNGELGGKKSIKSDADLPPVSSPEKSR
jgi:hypothetical protein